MLCTLDSETFVMTACKRPFNDEVDTDTSNLL